MGMIDARNRDDRRLLEGVLAADAVCVREVYDLALPSVIHWVRENNGTEADARDVFQEALIALFRKLEAGDFTLTCTLKSFLRVMCRNIWISQLRKKQRVDSRPYEELAFNPDPQAGGGVDWLEQSERDRLFLRHLEALGKDCQEILKGFFAKTPFREIAAFLGTSEGYVKKRKFICKQKLVENIQKDPAYKELAFD